MFCPKRQGFFPIIYQRVQDSLSPEEISEFEKCSTLEERIVFVWGLYRVDTIFKELLKPIYGEKNSSGSAKKRDAGNAQFYAGNYRQAQVMYSVAVFYAKISSNDEFKINNDLNNNRDYSLALANRSACYHISKRYKLALQDISLAIGVNSGLNLFLILISLLLILI
jgi:tetratricopeptide (TPR) repeat protein